MLEQEIPIIFAGNKNDLSGGEEDRREVQKEDVAEWVFCELPKLRAKVSHLQSHSYVHMLQLQKNNNQHNQRNKCSTQLTNAQYHVLLMIHHTLHLRVVYVHV